MSGSDELSKRIKAEFDARAQRLKADEQTRAKQSKQHDERLAQFSKICDELKSVWRPRLDEFARQFGDTIKVTPTVTPSQREAKIVFITEMATMSLTLTAAPNPDATSLVLAYDLLIVPIFFDYERSAKLEMPLDKIDKAAIAKWIDDRLISCVKAYLTMQDSEFYIRRRMVEDPITKSKLLPEDAKAKLDHEGRTLYFATEESFKKFKEKQQIK